MTSARLQLENSLSIGAVLALVLWLIAFGLAGRSQGQTICVGEPVMPLETQVDVARVKHEAEVTLRQHYQHVTNCEAADLELVVEPISGTLDTGDIYLSTQLVRTAGRITGTIRLEPLQQTYGAWMVVVFPRRGLHLSRERGGNLQKVVAKTIRMGRKQHWLDGNSG